MTDRPIIFSAPMVRALLAGRKVRAGTVQPKESKMKMALAIICLGLAASPASAAPTFPDRGRAGVVDAGGVIPDDQERALNERVVTWDRQTGHQLVVATVPDMQGLDVKDYGYQLGRAWGLGDKQRNDGAILLLAMKERKVRIEVGYGLEPVLTDAATSAILADAVVPNLKAGNAPAALAAGADAIMAAVPAKSVAPRSLASQPPEHHSTPWWLLLPVGLVAALGGWVAFWQRRAARQEAKAEAARANEDEARQLRRRRDEQARRAPDPMFAASPPFVPSKPATAKPARSYSAPPPPSPPAYVPPVYEAPRRQDDNSSSSSGSSFSSDWGSSGSSDSGSSSSGFDSGGGSFGGGGSDSSW